MLLFVQLRSSFTKAFSRSNNAKLATTKVQTQGVEQLDGGERQQASPPPSISNIATDSGLEVAELQKQLREKDLVLTDIRLEALSSAHQLESLKDTVMKMRVISGFLMLVTSGITRFFGRARC